MPEPQQRKRSELRTLQLRLRFALHDKERLEAEIEELQLQLARVATDCEIALEIINKIKARSN